MDHQFTEVMAQRKREQATIISGCLTKAKRTAPNRRKKNKLIFLLSLFQLFRYCSLSFGFSKNNTKITKKEIIKKPSPKKKIISLSHQITVIRSQYTTHVPHLPGVHVSVGPTRLPIITINTLTLSLYSHTEKKKNLSLTPSNLKLLFTFSLSLSAWHLKQSPSSPSPPLSSWRFSSPPPPPPLRICLRRRHRDPMPEQPDPFRARWP